MKIPKKIPKAIEELEHKQESNTVQSQPQKPKAQKRKKIKDNNNNLKLKNGLFFKGELQESSIFMDAFNVAASRPQRQRTNPTNTSQSTTPSSLNTQHINKLNTYSVSSPTNATFDSSKITNKNSNVIVDSKTTTTTTPSSDVYNNKDSRSNEPLVRILLIYSLLSLLFIMNHKNKNYYFILINELVEIVHFYYNASFLLFFL